MKILHIVENDTEIGLKQLIGALEGKHKIDVVKLDENVDYDALLEQVASHDKVVSWVNYEKS